MPIDNEMESRHPDYESCSNSNRINSRPADLLKTATILEAPLDLAFYGGLLTIPIQFN